jgi:hypothetical protein
VESKIANNARLHRGHFGVILRPRRKNSEILGYERTISKNFYEFREKLLSQSLSISDIA